MKIEQEAAVVISCKNMHVHWWDTMYLTYDDAAPLEIMMSLRDRVRQGGESIPDITWTLPRIDFVDAVSYGVQGQYNKAGIATLKVRRSDPTLIVIKVPYVGIDQRDQSIAQDQYFMFKILKLKLFIKKVERSVPQAFVDSMINIDHLIGQLLYA